jgi:hypothetical protein
MYRFKLTMAFPLRRVLLLLLGKYRQHHPDVVYTDSERETKSRPLASPSITGPPPPPAEARCPRRTVLTATGLPRARRPQDPETAETGSRSFDSYNILYDCRQTSSLCTPSGLVESFQLHTSARYARESSRGTFLRNIGPFCYCGTPPDDDQPVRTTTNIHHPFASASFSSAPTITDAMAVAMGTLAPCVSPYLYQSPFPSQIYLTSSYGDHC